LVWKGNDFSAYNGFPDNIKTPFHEDIDGLIIANNQPFDDEMENRLWKAVAEQQVNQIITFVERFDHRSYLPGVGNKSNKQE
jgi:hypothetical protein